MTPHEVRASATELFTLHHRFAPLFGHPTAQGHALTYLRGLLQHDGRKNAEAIALTFGNSQVRRVQQFIAETPWDYQAVQREIQSVFAESLVPSTASWGFGTVGVLDESGFPKKGTHSVGVARQWCGRLGKTDNCQVGVYLVGVTPAGCALMDHQLYLPKDWVLDTDRRAEVGIPRSVVFRTKPEIGLDLHARVRAAEQVSFDWLVFDELYGRDGDLLAVLERRRQRYVGEVPVTTTVWTEDPSSQVPPQTGRGRIPTRPARDSVRSVQMLGAELPPQSWRPLCLREGPGMPVAFEFAAVRTWSMRSGGPGPAVWVLFRRPVGGVGEVKYYVSNAGPEERLETLAAVSGCRWRVEEYFQDAKGYLGMDHLECRSWLGWHHHMALVAVAHLLVTKTRLRLKKKTGLSLDMAILLLKSALPQPLRTLEEALRLVEYHARRNEAAKRSHTRTWLARHARLRLEPLVGNYSPEEWP